MSQDAAKIAIFDKHSTKANSMTFNPWYLGQTPSLSHVIRRGDFPVSIMFIIKPFYPKSLTGRSWNLPQYNLMCMVLKSLTSHVHNG